MLRASWKKLPIQDFKPHWSYIPAAVLKLFAFWSRLHFWKLPWSTNEALRNCERVLTLPLTCWSCENSSDILQRWYSETEWHPLQHHPLLLCFGCALKMGWEKTSIIRVTFRLKHSKDIHIHRCVGTRASFAYNIFVGVFFPISGICDCSLITGHGSYICNSIYLWVWSAATPCNLSKGEGKSALLSSRQYSEPSRSHRHMSGSHWNLEWKSQFWFFW